VWSCCVSAEQKFHSSRFKLHTVFQTMKKFKIRYIILIIALTILVFNEGSRTLTRRFFEQRKLQSDIKSAKYQNELLKKRIYYLEHEPSYIERMVRSELNVIAPGEVEYRFHTKEIEEKIIKEKKNEDSGSELLTSGQKT